MEFMLTEPRRPVWAWGVPAAVAGWLAAGALFLSTIRACGWVVIESGIVSERVWGSSRGMLFLTTAVALLWVVAYCAWARRRNRSAVVVDALFCFGFGATAWFIPWSLLGYTLDDHWSEGKPFKGIPPLGEGGCGLDISPLGALLVGGGLLAWVAWVVWVVIDGSRDRAPLAHAPVEREDER